MARLQTLVAAGKIARKQWRDDYDRVCLLLALAPEVESTDGALDQYDPRRCPAHVMPGWFAQVVIQMDDEGTAREWPQMIGRFARVMSRALPVLRHGDWEVLRERVRIIAVAERMDTTRRPTVSGDISASLREHLHDAFGGTGAALCMDRMTTAILDAVDEVATARGGMESLIGELS